MSGKKERGWPSCESVGSRFRCVAGCAVFAAAVCLFAWIYGRFGLQPGEVQSETRVAEGSQSAAFAEYGGSASCKTCHEEAFADWENSHHALAERPVQAALDDGAFTPARSFAHGTQSSRLWSEGDSYHIQTPGLSGQPESFGLARVVGVSPLRQFLVPVAGGRFQVTEAAYDPRSNGWFNVYGIEDRKPGEWGHWTGRGMNWNYMCAGCHNTRVARNYNRAADTYQTKMAEAAVGCEACHGPLRAHNDWQLQFGKSGRKDPTLPKFSRAQVLDTCGFCHARRTELTGDWKPRDAFSDQFQLALLDHSGQFYADGQIKEEDYEYASFLSSKMQSRGITCVDCHHPHSSKTLLPGNWLCLRCHSGGDTNAPVINPVQHSRHQVFGFDTNGQPHILDLSVYPAAPKQAGGECVNCHMPRTVYMQRHWRHDHGFTSPDPLLTKKFGIPNACNRCHQDKDADWAVKYCDEWYGTNMDRSTRQRAIIVAQGMRSQAEARGSLAKLMREDASGYWRAVAAGLLAPWAGRPEVAVMLLQALQDTNALVRTSAAGALENALAVDNRDAFRSVGRLLDDPVRSVRVAAAFALRATVPPQSRAGRELQAYFDVNADQPAGQMQEAVYLFSRNALQAALTNLERAAQWDSHSVPIKQELGVVLSALNRPQDAAEALKEACRLAPQDAESHFRYGLACNELGNLKGAAEHLEQAAKLDPRNARAWYNLGLAQNTLGLRESAIESLSRAETEDPEDRSIPYARATVLAQLGRIADAKAAARRALELDPAFGPAKELLEALTE